MEAYKAMQVRVNEFLKSTGLCHEQELNKFHHILENPIDDYEIVPLCDLAISEIYSSGYVLHTLEAALWCFLKTDTYAEAVLTAVNLGQDTDTTGCVTGALAGLYYGAAAIPEEWLSVLVKRKEIEDLAQRLDEKMSAAK